MRKTFRWLIAAGIVLQFLSSTVYGGFKETITQNQVKAAEYITQLKAGADPDTLTRPQLRRNQKDFKAKQSVKEINKAMDEAESLARDGKHDLIQKPDFNYEGVSEGEPRTSTYGNKN